ncbi:unnamed protein product [Allacma fusca]|uniref:AIG1-type G domain-containing protein n=1 Tax=Allacma fusca TaxID=39272 RepID=A0A8J2KE51_9HEXA|nr:unnamed protein product [Allacma fusca]
MKVHLNFIVSLISWTFLQGVLTSLPQETTVVDALPTSSTFENDNGTKTQALDDTIELMTTDDNYIPNHAPRSVVLVLGKAETGLNVGRFLTEKNMEFHKNRRNKVLKETGIPNGSDPGNSVLPKIIIDNSRNITFYILGSREGSKESPDIAIASFIKDLAGHAKKLKILFVLNYSTVTKGNHREIMDLLKHATNLIKAPLKFRQAMNLVTVNMKSESDPEKDLEGVTKLLKSVRTKLKNHFTDDPKNEKQAEDICNALLTKGGEETYSNIFCISDAIQNQTHSLSENQDEPSPFEQSLFSQTKFVTTSPNDFLIDLSDDGKGLAQNITPIMIEMLFRKVVAISEDIILHFQDLKANNNFSSFGNVIKDYKSLQNLNRTLQESLSTPTFVQELYQLSINMKLPHLQKKITSVTNQVNVLNFMGQILEETIPIGIEKLSSQVLQTIPNVKILVEEMITAFDLQITSFEQLESKVRNKSVEQMQIQNSETSKLQLTSLSESLLNVIDSSLHAPSYNQLVSEVQEFLTNNSLIESVHPIIPTLSADIDFEETRCLFSTQFKAWKLLHHLELFWRFIGKEKTRLELKDLTEAYLDNLNQLTLTNTNNLTKHFNDEAILLSTLSTKRNEEKAQFESQLFDLVSNCNQNLTDINANYQILQSSFAAKIQEQEKVLKSKKDQEAINTQSIHTNCTTNESQWAIKLAIEQQQNSASLEEARKGRTKQSNELKLTFSQEIKEKERRCRSDIVGKENNCTSQKNDARKISEEEKLSWEKTNEQTSTACNQELNKMEAICSQEKDQLRVQSQSRIQELRSALTREGSQCTARKETANQGCNQKVRNAEAAAQQEATSLKDQNSNEGLACCSTLSTTVALYESNKRNLVQNFEREVDEFIQTCQGRKSQAESQARNDFERQLQHYIYRWERSDRCCYPRGGRCRDGASGTGCCSYSSCTYQFLKAHCCKCSSHCRM